jgi:hypothetical protein
VGITLCSPEGLPLMGELGALIQQIGGGHKKSPAARSHSRAQVDQQTVCSLAGCSLPLIGEPEHHVPVRRAKQEKRSASQAI